VVQGSGFRYKVSGERLDEDRGINVHVGDACVRAGRTVVAQRGPAPARPTATTADPAARPTPRLIDGHPNLNGFWAIGRGPDTPVGSGFGERDPNIKRGAARNAAAQYADPNQPPYKPELLAKVQDPEVLTRPWTMNPWVSVRTTKELLVENPPCVELDIDHVTSFDEKTKPQP